MSSHASHPILPSRPCWCGRACGCRWCHQPHGAGFNTGATRPAGRLPPPHEGACSAEAGRVGRDSPRGAEPHLVPKAKHHRRPHVKGVALALEVARAAAWDEVPGRGVWRRRSGPGGAGRSPGHVSTCGLSRPGGGGQALLLGCKALPLALGHSAPPCALPSSVGAGGTRGMRQGQCIMAR